MNAPQIGERLPNADKARIDIERKLRGYALNPDHQPETGFRGADKARVFRAILGITAEDADELAEQLRAGLPESPVNEIHGRRYVTYGISIEVSMNERSAAVTTAWELRDGIPHLVTAYIES